MTPLEAKGLSPKEKNLRVAQIHLGVKPARRFVGDALLLASAEAKSEACRLGGWTPDGELWSTSLPKYTQDLNVIAVARRKAPRTLYMANLAAVLGYPEDVQPGTERHEEMIFAMVEASAERHCEALIATCDREQEPV